MLLCWGDLCTPYSVLSNCSPSLCSAEISGDVHQVCHEGLQERCIAALTLQGAWDLAVLGRYFALAALVLCLLALVIVLLRKVKPILLALLYVFHCCARRSCVWMSDYGFCK